MYREVGISVTGRLGELDKVAGEVHIQGGVMNHGLLFAGPPPPPLGGCERKD
jgi:hypothetical protein